MLEKEANNLARYRCAAFLVGERSNGFEKNKPGLYNRSCVNKPGLK
jgi:hypothetical protein